MADLVYPPVIAVARGLFLGLRLKFNVEGQENIPREGGAVLACNHIGYLDFTFCGLAARPIKRLVRFMAKAEVFKHPIAGPLMRGMKHIPVDRSSAGAGGAAFGAALTALREGELVGIFPEATISESYEVKQLKPGAAKLALESGVPLIPVAIWGSQRIYTKGRKMDLSPGKAISVRVGAPVEIREDDTPATLTARLREELTALVHQVQAEYPQQPSDEPGADWWVPARMGGSAPELPQL